MEHLIKLDKWLFSRLVTAKCFLHFNSHEKAICYSIFVTNGLFYLDFIFV